MSLTRLTLSSVHSFKSKPIGEIYRWKLRPEVRQLTGTLNTTNSYPPQRQLVSPVLVIVVASRNGQADKIPVLTLPPCVHRLLVTLKL